MDLAAISKKFEEIKLLSSLSEDLKLKYEVKIEDLVNALNNLQQLMSEYFNLDQNIDPDNRHLGEPGLLPSTGPNSSMDTERKSVNKEKSNVEDLMKEIKDLLDQLMNPQDVDDQAELNPESIKDSDLVDEEENLPPGPIESLLGKEENGESEEKQQEQVESNSTTEDSETESNEEKEEKEIVPTDTKPPIELPKSENEDEEEDEEDDGYGPGNQGNESTNNVGWYGSKSIQKTAESKGMDHFKSLEDGIIQSKQPISFSNFGKSSIEDYYPTDEELVDINTNHSLINMKKEDLIVLPIMAADTNVDRGSEHFTTHALESFVPLYIGKALLLDHTWTTQNEVGKIFAAKVENGNKLMVKAYIPNTAHNSKLISNIMSGVHCRASVGFSMDVRNATCDSCSYSMSMKRKGPPTTGMLEGTISIFDEDNCPHKPGAMDEYGNKTTVTLHKVSDVMELSFVPVPMQPKAGTNRALSFSKALDKLDSKLSLVQEHLHGFNEDLAKSASEVTIMDSSNIISSRTMGETIVSDMKENTQNLSQETDEGKAFPSEGSFDVEGNEHRPTDDNLFARAAIKNMHDLSENLKSITVELKEAVDSMKSLYEIVKAEKACSDNMDESEEDEEEKAKSEEKEQLLAEAIKTLVELLESKKEKSTTEEEISAPEGAWMKSLINQFESGVK